MSNQPDEADDMKQEYDFSAGVRGKHAAAFQQGYTVRILKPDGSVQEETHPPRLVELDEDVFAYFPDSAAVNRALRALIEIVPRQKSA
jgi:hypothetical protein